MNNKFFAYLFPVGGGAGGSLFGFITFGEIAQTAVSAAIFAIVGGVIGYFVSKLMKKIDKK
ncbi:hypothetical protein ES704_03658 [subsurface metagenome]|jgi:membrane associated rhomboid family serine protease